MDVSIFQSTRIKERERERERESWAEQEEDQKTKMPVQNVTYNYSIDDLWMTKHMQK